jgi:hypothetical protein
MKSGRLKEMGSVRGRDAIPFILYTDIFLKKGKERQGIASFPF